jgi:hypothetical protein
MIHMTNQALPKFGEGRGDSSRTQSFVCPFQSSVKVTQVERRCEPDDPKPGPRPFSAVTQFSEGLLCQAVHFLPLEFGSSQAELGSRALGQGGSRLCPCSCSLPNGLPGAKPRQLE